MNKNLLFVIGAVAFIVLCVNVSAALVNFNPVNASNCFNYTVKIEQSSGNESTFYPLYCDATSSNTWFCKCRTANNEDYPIWFAAEDRLLREPATYKVTIDLRTYEFKANRTKFRLENWGDYREIYGLTNQSLGDDFKTVYINNTVYRDRNITVDKIVIVNHTINNTVYVDRNITVEKNVTVEKIVEVKDKSSNIYITMLLIFSALLIVYIVREKLKKIEVKQ